jgi:hypothetical protein
MAIKKLKFEDFGVEKLSTSQQKAINGGDGEGTIDPTKEKEKNGYP